MARMSLHIGIIPKTAFYRIFNQRFVSKLKRLSFPSECYPMSEFSTFTSVQLTSKLTKRDKYANFVKTEKQPGKSISDEVLFARNKLQEIDSPQLNKNDEIIYKTSFGHVRFDSNNYIHSNKGSKKECHEIYNKITDYDSSETSSDSKDHSAKNGVTACRHELIDNACDGQTTNNVDVSVNRFHDSKEQKQSVNNENLFADNHLNYFDKHILEESKHNDSFSDLPEDHMSNLKDTFTDLIASGNVFDKAIIELSNCTDTEKQKSSKGIELPENIKIYTSSSLHVESTGSYNYFDESLLKQTNHNEFLDLQKQLSSKSSTKLEENVLNNFDANILEPDFCDKSPDVQKEQLEHTSNREDSVLFSNDSGTVYNRTDKDYTVSEKSSYGLNEVSTGRNSPKEYDLDLNFMEKDEMLKQQHNEEQSQKSKVDKLLVSSKAEINKNDKVSQKFSDRKNKVKVEKNSPKELDQSIIEKAKDDGPKTAHDLVMSMRKEKRNNTSKEPDPSSVEIVHQFNPWMKKWDGKTDSRGFRILTGQVMNLEIVPQDTLVTILKKSILYEDDSLVAISKPYNLASHGGPGINNSVGKVVRKLAERVDKNLETLYLVHRLDKETTGVMLLAKSAKMCTKLGNMFTKREIAKKYLVVTKGVPNPEEGVIDIPITEGMVGNKYRMTLKPRLSSDMKKDLNIHQFRGMSGVFRAVTNYKVLSSYGNAALVECQAETGVKHQIRCHLAFAMNTPILGDHKYSHLSKIAPQKLPPDMLQRLVIRQAKVRHVPMHLHASELVIPQLYKGQNLFIKAQLPQHFVQNMKWLRLSLKGSKK